MSNSGRDFQRSMDEINKQAEESADLLRRKAAALDLLQDNRDWRIGVTFERTWTIRDPFGMLMYSRAGRKLRRQIGKVLMSPDTPKLPLESEAGKLAEPYSFKFNKARDTWVCSVHGDVDSVGWVPCWNGCNEGYFDDYEEDPIECELGEISTCSECKGEGGWRVCGECNAKNPDVEW